MEKISLTVLIVGLVICLVELVVMKKTLKNDKAWIVGFGIIIMSLGFTFFIQDKIPINVTAPLWLETIISLWISTIGLSGIIISIIDTAFIRVLEDPDGLLALGTVAVFMAGALSTMVLIAAS